MAQELGYWWELLVVLERCFIKVQILTLQQTGDFFLRRTGDILLCETKPSEQ